jgi:hypothetical protein
MNDAAFQDAGLRLYTPKSPMAGLLVLKEDREDVDHDEEIAYDGLVPLPRVPRVPHRATVFVVTAIVCIVSGLLRPSDRSTSDTVLLALIGLAGAFIGGDTYRPSGMAPPARAKPVKTEDEK